MCCNAVASEAIPGWRPNWTLTQYSPITTTSRRRVHATIASLHQLAGGVETRKDVVIFEKDEVLTALVAFFSVFTPYKNAW